MQPLGEILVVGKRWVGLASITITSPVAVRRIRFVPTPGLLALDKPCGPVVLVFYRVRGKLAAGPLRMPHFFR